MKFTIIIPTVNNFEYLKLCINSINKNSAYEHQLIIHINGVDIATENYLKVNNFEFTSSDTNIGLCSGVNLASKKAKTDYILYAHDDMYFLPKWDLHLKNEINMIDHNQFYLSMTQLSHKKGVKATLQHIYFDCGSNLNDFDEVKLLDNYSKFEFRNLQGSHWAPHLIHKEMWNKVGGFSEEFNPGFASDPDLNMKLWNSGVRIFKGVSLSRVYHFGSLTTRNNKKIIPNNGRKVFLLKWKFTVEFFTKHFLKRGSTFDGPLKSPTKNFIYFFDLFFVKLKYFINSLK